MARVFSSPVVNLFLLVVLFMLDQQQSHSVYGTRTTVKSTTKKISQQKITNLKAFKERLRKAKLPNAGKYVKFTDHLFRQGYHRVKQSFCYTKPNCGPNNWVIGSCSTGYYQSPINLDPKSSTQRQIVDSLKFNEAYKIPQKFLLTNNGHTVLLQFNAEGTSEAEFCIVDRHDCYVFAQLHFHWSQNQSQGSEHTIEEKKFPMELHMIHYKKVYGNLGKALAASDVNAVAVIGIVVKVGSLNLALETVVEKVGDHGLKPVDGLFPTNGSIKLADILPRNKAFYLYSGSLTVPPCTEKILWTVFHTPITIDRQQLAMFHKVIAPNEVELNMMNFRPLQRTSGRLVEYFS